MVAKCEVFISRNKLNSRQYQPDETSVIQVIDKTESDLDYFEQTVDLLLLIYKCQDTLNQF